MANLIVEVYKIHLKCEALPFCMSLLIELHVLVQSFNLSWRLAL